MFCASIVQWEPLYIYKPGAAIVEFYTAISFSLFGASLVHWEPYIGASWFTFRKSLQKWISRWSIKGSIRPRSFQDWSSSAAHSNGRQPLSQRAEIGRFGKRLIFPIAIWNSRCTKRYDEVEREGGARSDHHRGSPFVDVRVDEEQRLGQSALAISSLIDPVVLELVGSRASLRILEPAPSHFLRAQLETTRCALMSNLCTRPGIPPLPFRRIL